MNSFRQWQAPIVLVLCGAFIACSSGTDTKGDRVSGTSDTGVTAQGGIAPAGRPSANYGGAVDAITCTVISGWEWNSSNPDDHVGIDILVDNKVAGTTTASLPRMDLKDVTKQADPRYAFSWPIPPELKDGKTHTVSVRVAGGTQEVQIWKDVKPSFTCSPQ